MVPPSNQEGIPPYLDEIAMTIPGRPGYRTRPGRSGLDPLDNRFELAYMEGLFIRRLITGRLRTHNVLYLVLMAATAAFCLTLAALPVFEYLTGGIVYVDAWCAVAEPAVLGTLLAWNLALNFLHRRNP
jgi:hypothetical protein